MLGGKTQHLYIKKRGHFESDRSAQEAMLELVCDQVQFSEETFSKHMSATHLTCLEPASMPCCRRSKLDAYTIWLRAHVNLGYN